MHITVVFLKRKISSAVIATTTTTHHVAGRASGVTRQQNVASTEIGAPASLCAQERPSEISAPTGSCSAGYQPGNRGSKFYNNNSYHTYGKVRCEK